MKKIGFVGLGIMGAAMARNLIDAGYEVSVYNRTVSRAEPLREAGASVCATPAEVGTSCELVFTCVSDAPDVEAVIVGENGVASGMTSGGIIVDNSTSSPDLAKRMAVELAPRGIGILDAPVSGGPEGAKNATLAIMCGGDETIFNKALPVIEHLGKSVVLVGPAGAGQLTKAVNQTIVAANLLAVSEGIALAKRSGLDAKKVFEAISGGGASSWALTMRSPLMLDETFTPPNFALALHAKDLRIASNAAESCGADLTIAKQVNEIVQALVEAGHGEIDHSAIHLYTKQKNDI